MQLTYFQVPKCIKFKIYRPRTPLGELTRSPDPLAGGKGLAPKNPSPALGPSAFGLSRPPVVEIWQIQPRCRPTNLLSVKTAERIVAEIMSSTDSLIVLVSWELPPLWNSHDITSGPFMARFVSRFLWIRLQSMQVLHPHNCGVPNPSIIATQRWRSEVVLPDSAPG